MILKSAYYNVSRRDAVRDRWSTHALNIRRSVAVDLIARKYYQIGLLLVQNTFDEFQCPWIRIAVAAIGTFGFRISALAQPGAEMQIGYLHDLELAILPDLGHRLLDLVWCASTYAQAWVLAVLSCVQMQCTILDQLPSGAWLHCVRPKEYVDSSHGLLRVARVTLE